jgi:uncharacterized protein YkwD
VRDVLHTKYFVGGLLVAAISITTSINGVNGVVGAIGNIGRAATVGTHAVRVDPPRGSPVAPEGQGLYPLVDLVNAQRAKSGLAPVAWHDQVAAAAQAHSADMAAMNRMSHTGSDGSNAGDRLHRAGFTWQSWGENIAAGLNSNEAVFDAWMASPDHRRQILGSYTYIGDGAVAAGDGTVYWTMDLAR